jgi:DNA-binding LytR/AlgR family response regulator
MKRCLVIEDDFGFYLEAESVLKQLGFDLIDNAASVHQVIQFMASSKYDLIISDIVLENGEKVTEYFDSNPTDIPIIFMSVLHNEAVYQSIQKNKKHLFLVKPINPFTLKSSIEYIHTMQVESGKLEDQKNPTSTLRIKDGGSFVHLNIDEIHFIKSEGNYCSFFISDNRLTTRERLSFFGDKLKDFGFFQIHKSYIVNVRKIKRVNFPQNYVIIEDKEIPIGRKFKKGFRSFYYQM